MSDRVTRSKSVRDTLPKSKRSVESRTKSKPRRKVKVPVRSRSEEDVTSPDENEYQDPIYGNATITDRVGLAKRSLHTSIPTNLPCRQRQIDYVYNFINTRLVQVRGGGLYISGSPGTGKTVVITYVLEMLKGEKTGKTRGFVPIFINCMNLGSPLQIFEQIGFELKFKQKGEELRERIIERFTSKSGKMFLLILDEMDQLLNSRGNDVLYKIFETAQAPDSKLIVVGIANSLDLTTRHLPHLSTTSSPAGSKVKRRGSSVTADKKDPIEVFHFTPYERDDIAQILETRLKAVDGLFDPNAIKFVAAKVASSTGDMRKALHACKTALDQLEKEGRTVLKTTADDGFNTDSPKKIRIDLTSEKIGLGSIAKVLKFDSDLGALPVQQLLLLATLLRLHLRMTLTSSSSIPPIPLTTIYQEYSRLSQWKGYEHIDMSDIVSIFTMLEDRSLVTFAPTNGGTPSSKKGSKLLKRARSVDAVTCDPGKIESLFKGSDLFNSIVYS